MADLTEADRLRALLSVAKDFDLVELRLPDGLHFRRELPSPTQAAYAVAAQSTVVDEDGDEIADEQRAEQDLRREWTRYWSRSTRSSGAAIPDFPGVDAATRFLGGRQ